MKRFRKNDGFTLVELMVTILTATIVTLSATTILLLGIRIMNKSNNTAEKQYTTRVLLTAMEDLAAEGTITEVREERGQNEDGTQEVTLSWQVLNGTKAVFSYDRAEQTIYTGAGENRAPLLTEVTDSAVTLSDSTHVLTFFVTTDQGTYESSVYCRMMPDVYRGDNTGTNLVDELIGGNDIVSGVGSSYSGRNAFLKVLASQYGSRGYIMDDQGRTDTYYSEWYVDGYTEENRANGWNENTPWCACYVSWALCHNDVKSKVNPLTRPSDRWIANVETFRQYFGELEQVSKETTIAGDIIFFNTDDDLTDADHMGVVLAVTDDKVYTIEGNSYNRVRVRDYDLSDTENGIMGYGVLDWTQ